jgi:hypothetical protein
MKIIFVSLFVFLLKLNTSQETNQSPPSGNKKLDISIERALKLLNTELPRTRKQYNPLTGSKPKPTF